MSTVCSENNNQEESSKTSVRSCPFWHRILQSLPTVPRVKAEGARKALLGMVTARLISPSSWPVASPFSTPATLASLQVLEYTKPGPPQDLCISCSHGLLFRHCPQCSLLSLPKGLCRCVHFSACTLLKPATFPLPLALGSPFPSLPNFSPSHFPP